jgi:PAS domain-containing protein
MPWALLLPVVAATIVARGAQNGAWSDEFALCLLALAALGVIQALIAGGVAVAGRNEELRAALERESRADRRRFTTLTSRAPIGIFETDAAGRTTYVNEALLEIAGVDLASALQGRRRAGRPPRGPRARRGHVARLRRARVGLHPRAPPPAS